MTVPNFLTILRILLTPLLVWLLLDQRLGQALAVFFIAGATDGLDGLIARVFHQKSKLGAYLDPLADKLLLVTSFILLGHLGLVPYWLVIVAVGRDAVILLGFTALLLRHVEVQIKPLFMSKMTTLLQLASVLVAMSSSFLAIPAPAKAFVFGCAAVLSIISGVQYVSIGFSLHAAHKSSGNQG